MIHFQFYLTLTSETNYRDRQPNYVFRRKYEIGNEFLYINSSFALSQLFFYVLVKGWFTVFSLSY